MLLACARDRVPLRGPRLLVLAVEPGRALRRRACSSPSWRATAPVRLVAALTARRRARRRRRVRRGQGRGRLDPAGHERPLAARRADGEGDRAPPARRASASARSRRRARPSRRTVARRACSSRTRRRSPSSPSSASSGSRSTPPCCSALRRRCCARSGSTTRSGSRSARSSPPSSSTRCSTAASSRIPSPGSCSGSPRASSSRGQGRRRRRRREWSGSTAGPAFGVLGVLGALVALERARARLRPVAVPDAADLGARAARPARARRRRRWDLGVVRTPAVLAGVLVAAIAVAGWRAQTWRAVGARRRLRRSDRARHRARDAAPGRPPRRLGAVVPRERLDLPDRARRGSSCGTGTRRTGTTTKAPASSASTAETAPCRRRPSIRRWRSGTSRTSPAPRSRRRPGASCRSPFDDYRVLVLLATIGCFFAVLLFDAPLPWRLVVGSAVAASPLLVRGSWFGTADATASWRCSSPSRCSRARATSGQPWRSRRRSSSSSSPSSPCRSSSSCCWRAHCRGRRSSAPAAHSPRCS